MWLYFLCVYINLLQHYNNALKIHWMAMKAIGWSIMWDHSHVIRLEFIFAFSAGLLKNQSRRRPARCMGWSISKSCSIFHPEKFGVWRVTSGLDPIGLILVSKIYLQLFAFASLFTIGVYWGSGDHVAHSQPKYHIVQLSVRKCGNFNGFHKKK